MANEIQFRTRVGDTVDLEGTEPFSKSFSIEVLELTSWLNGHMDSLE